MAGRAKGVAVSNVSVRLVAQSLDRIGLIFTVGDSTNASSVILKDVDDATATNGVPITALGEGLEVEGKLARHQWSAIRLAAVDCIVGVVEIFPEAVLADEPSVVGVPTGKGPGKDEEGDES